MTLEIMALAQEINSEHEQCVNSMRAGLEHAIRAGELLSQAKAACQHGTWVQWIADNCQFTPRQAQRYMLVAERKDELLAKTTHVSHLSFRGALALLAEPQAEPVPEFQVNNVVNLKTPPAAAPGGDVLEQAARALHVCMAAEEHWDAVHPRENNENLSTATKAAGAVWYEVSSCMLDDPALTLPDAIRIEKLARDIANRSRLAYLHSSWELGTLLAGLLASGSTERELLKVVEGKRHVLTNCLSLAEIDADELSERINQILDDPDGELTTT
jgi:hypothetical protein